VWQNAQPLNAEPDAVSRNQQDLKKDQFKVTANPIAASACTERGNTCLKMFPTPSIFQSEPNLYL
jgi:hypothetical protein